MNQQIMRRSAERQWYAYTKGYRLLGNRRMLRDCRSANDERGAQLSQEYPPLADQLMGTKDRKAQCRNGGHLFQFLWSISLVILAPQTFHREAEITLRRSFDSTWARQ